MKGAQGTDFGDFFQPPKLPFELLDLIAQLAISTATKERDAETVKTYSLLFSGWRIPFQRALLKIWVPYLHFSECASREENNIIYTLRNLLGVNPSFQQAITSLRLRILGSGTLRDSTPDFMPVILSQLTSVDTLRISQVHRRSHSWAGLTDEAQAAVSALLRSPSLRHLDIPWFDAPLAITFQEGVEMDTVNIPSDRFPDIQGDHLYDGSDLNDLDITKSPIRPCIVRHLKSTTSIASKLLRATRASQTGRTPIIDSFAMHSVHLTMKNHGELQDLRAVLHLTSNLQKLIVRAAMRVANYAPGGGMDGLFQKPQPGCLTNLEEIDLTFHPINKPENLIKVIIHEFSIYPPANVLKNVIMKIPCFKQAYVLPVAEKLREDLVELGDLFGKTCRFPFLECVEVIPELGTIYGLDSGWDWELGTGFEYLSKSWKRS